MKVTQKVNARLEVIVEFDAELEFDFPTRAEFNDDNPGADYDDYETALEDAIRDEVCNLDVAENMVWDNGSFIGMSDGVTVVSIEGQNIEVAE